MEPLFAEGRVKAKVNNINRLAFQTLRAGAGEENAASPPPLLNKSNPHSMSSITSPHLYRPRSYSRSANMVHDDATLLQRALWKFNIYRNRYTNRNWRPLQQRRRGAGKSWSVRDAMGVRNLVRVLWVLVVWWGERRVFNTAIQNCSWENWEEWVWHLLLLQFQIFNANALHLALRCNSPPYGPHR